MACGRGSLSWSLMLVGIVYLVLTLASVSARESLEQEASSQNHGEEVEFNYLTRVSKPLRGLDYKHVWPEMRFGWKIVVSTLIGFLGAAFGSVGGVGGGGFFVPMLTLIIGFDQKSSTAISKCMITGGAAATVLYNLRQRHPTLELPLIDYDLAVLLQPMLVLGISIGVSLNVVLAEWMITILLIVVLLGTSTKSFFKGVDTWKKETAKKKNLLEASKSLQPKSSSSEGIEDKRMPGGTSNVTNEPKETKRKVVSILDNVRWKQLGVIVLVWTIILAVQIAKNSVRKCSVAYWLLDLSQIPVTVGISSYEAVKLYKGQRIIASKGEAATSWRVHKLVSYCVFGMVAGIIGGLLGLGGGFIMGPLFLEMGIPPQVSSATSTFIMTFSSSMSVVEYYLLKRFPVPYALYFAAVAIVSAVIGQHVVGKVIKALGRTSLIIFILSLTIFVSALSLGGVGIANIIKKIQHKESFGFQKMCS